MVHQIIAKLFTHTWIWQTCSFISMSFTDIICFLLCFHLSHINIGILVDWPCISLTENGIMSWSLELGSRGHLDGPPSKTFFHSLIPSTWNASHECSHNMGDFSQYSCLATLQVCAGDYFLLWHGWTLILTLGRDEQLWVFFALVTILLLYSVLKNWEEKNDNNYSTTLTGAKRC